jgi:AcrR family transcriptional regulator
MPDPAKPKRGRPRDSAVRKKILMAAGSLLDEGGLGAVTMEAVAARAGVGKPTIYREWPNAQAVAMAAFLETAQAAPGGKIGKSPLATLKRQLRKIAEVFSTRAGRNTAMMIAAAQNDSELAKVFRNHFILSSREEGRLLLVAAQRVGELRADFDIEVALDLVYAPLYFRLLIGHGPLDGAFTDGLLEMAVAGLRMPEAKIKP